MRRQKKLERQKNRKNIKNQQQNNITKQSYLYKNRQVSSKAAADFIGGDLFEI